MVRESIEKVVPAKTWTKKNGRIVSEETKALYEERTRQYQKDKPTQSARKRWNRKLRASCKKDYRTWVTGCTQRIEQADNRGDTKAIYTEVKRLSGIVSRGANTRPTAVYQAPNEKGAAEVLNRAANTCEAEATRNDDQGKPTGETATRTDESKARTSTRNIVTAKNTRSNRKEELESKRQNETTDCTPPGCIRGSRDKFLGSGTSKNAAAHARARIDGPADLANNWQRFLAQKFSATEMEKL